MVSHHPNHSQAAPASSALDAVVKEVESVIHAIDSDDLDRFVRELLAAKRIYMAGQGRSGLAGQGLAQRLMHIGLTTYVVGQIVVPAMTEGDVCVAIAASGRTHTTVYQAKRAIAAGGRVLAVTQPQDSPLREMAHWSLTIPSARPGGRSPQQHATTLFCQVTQLLFDSVCQMVQTELNQDDSDLHRRHTNFE